MYQSNNDAVSVVQLAKKDRLLFVDVCRSIGSGYERAAQMFALASLPEIRSTGSSNVEYDEHDRVLRFADTLQILQIQSEESV